MSTSTHTGPPVVRFGRRQSKGILLGFSGPRLIALSAALISFVCAIVLLGGVGLVASIPFSLPLIAAAFVRWKGEPLADAAPVVAHWAARRFARQTRYRCRPAAPRPAGTLALPGDAAALRVHVDDVSGAAMIHDPHRRTLSAVVALSHPAYVLLSPDDQARRVTAWSRVLAGLAITGTGASVQIMESTLPDPGRGVRDWFLDNRASGRSWTTEQYEALLDQSAPRSHRHRSLVVVTLELRHAARAVRDAGRGLPGAASVLRSEMIKCVAALHAADLRIDGWINAPDLAGIIREAYDPVVDPSECRASLASAGPVAVDEHWDHIRHDSGYSSVLWISEWPRTEVAAHFLHALIFLQDVRKTVSIVARPLATGEALRSIRKEKVEYLTDAQQSARIGKLTDFATEQEYADVLTRERALTSGHADMRFSGFVVVTCKSRDELSNAVASAERAASQCGCETRVLVGQQAQAFAVAALPLGRMAH